MNTNKLLFYSMVALLVSSLLLLSTNCDNNPASTDNNNGNDNDNHDIEYGEMSDERDGNTYKTVQIGSQTWMAENLKYLPSVAGAGSGSITNPYHYVSGYEGSNVADAKATDNYTIYGVLYNWPAALHACPAGWKLPGNDDWTELTEYLGGDAIAGGKLKATGTIEAETGLWRAPNEGATNETGFTALPGSHRDYNGNFHDFGVHGFWWSSTEHLQHTAWYRRMNHVYENVNAISYHKDWAFSVRCVKD